MITTLLGNLMRNHGIIMQNRLADDSGRTFSIHLIVDKRTNHMELRVQCTQGLKNLVFPMCLLQANNVSLLHQALEITDASLDN